MREADAFPCAALGLPLQVGLDGPAVLPFQGLGVSFTRAGHALHVLPDQLRLPSGGGDLPQHPVHAPRVNRAEGFGGAGGRVPNQRGDLFGGQRLGFGVLSRLHGQFPFRVGGGGFGARPVVSV